MLSSIVSYCFIFLELSFLPLFFYKLILELLIEWSEMLICEDYNLIGVSVKASVGVKVYILPVWEDDLYGRASLCLYIYPYYYLSSYFSSFFFEIFIIGLSCYLVFYCLSYCIFSPFYCFKGISYALTYFSPIFF